MKLIDADDALEIVDRVRLFGKGNCDKVRKLIEDLPETVVRCRDCEYWNMHIDGIDKWARCDFFSTPKKVAVMTSSDGFCADGIRKEDR